MKIMHKYMMNRNTTNNSMCKKIESVFNSEGQTRIKCVLKDEKIRIRVLKTIDFEKLSKFPILELSIYTETPITKLPQELELLKIYDTYDSLIPSNLPEGLEVLQIGNKFNQPLPKLPNKLQLLKIGDAFNQNIVFDSRSELKILTLGKSFNKKINFLPTHLKKLVISNPDYSYKLPIEEFDILLFDKVNVYGITDKSLLSKHMNTLKENQKIKSNTFNNIQIQEKKVRTINNMLRELEEEPNIFAELKEKKDYTGINETMDKLEKMIDTILSVKLSTSETDSFNNTYKQGLLIPWLGNKERTVPEIYLYPTLNKTETYENRLQISFYIYVHIFNILVSNFVIFVESNLNKSNFDAYNQIVINTLSQVGNNSYYNFFNSFYLQLFNLVFEKKYNINELTYEFIRDFYERQKIQENIPFEVYSIFVLLGRHIKFFLMQSTNLRNKLNPNYLFYYSVISTSFEDYKIFLHDMDIICDYYINNMHVFSQNPYFIQFFNFIQYLLKFVKIEIFSGMRQAQMINKSVLNEMQSIQINDISEILLSFVYGEKFSNKLSRNINRVSLQINRDYKLLLLQQVSTTADKLGKYLSSLSNLVYNLREIQKTLKDEYFNLQQELEKEGNIDKDILESATEIIPRVESLIKLDFSKNVIL